MKTSFCTNVFSNEDMEMAIKKLAQLGYDGLEFWDKYLQKIDIFWLVDFLKENHIEVSQICPYFNFTGTKEEWKNSILLAEKYIKLAKILDTKLIRVFTGKVGSKEATSAKWRLAVLGLKKICELGVKDKILFVLETHPGTLADTSDSTLNLLEKVGMENLKVNLQVPLIGEKNPLISAEKLGEYVVHLHAHNWKYLNEDYRWGAAYFS
jgi:3-dehydroshikimate dehydratase